MANKSNRNGQSSWRKEALDEKPWPYIPKQLLSYISTQTFILEHLSIPGTIKAFRSPSRCCQSTKHPQMAELVAVGVSDWPSQLKKKSLYPNIHHLGDPFWKSKCCLLLFRGTGNPYFAFYWQRGENVCFKRDCTIIDPNDPNKHFMRFRTAIACRGIIFALSLQGTVAVIEEIGSDLTITAISKSRAVPSVTARYFREFLVESDGEILLVFLISLKSMTNVDQVEVFKLQIDKLRWVKMDDLGDRALFVKQASCIWVKASKVGCESNNVFFSTTIDHWGTYNLKSGTISSGYSKNAVA